MTRTSDDRIAPELRSWLGTSIDDLPSGDELPPEVRSDVLSRLPSTLQRRRWWPFRWFPFGIGATRSADAEEPRSERRTRSMFTATRIAASVAILALAGSLALVIGPRESDPMTPGAPADSSATDVAAFPVTGTAGIKVLENGEDTGDHLRNRLGSNIQMEMSDPRVSGEVRFLHHADDYGRVGVEWGTYRLENDEGAWQGPVSGFYGPRETRTSGWLAGEGAYEGLTYYLESVIDHGTLIMTINGMVYPGAPPMDFPELSPIE